MEAASATKKYRPLSLQLIISAQDPVLARYGNSLAALGEGRARTALSRALNHEGDKGRTQVKRALVKQTGIKYGAVDRAMATIRATPATLTYTLRARGDETNIAWFGGLQRRKGVSAAPWNKRRIFARSFIVPRFGGAFIRTSKNRLPIRSLYGPNLARESSIMIVPTRPQNSISVCQSRPLRAKRDASIANTAPARPVSARYKGRWD